jgi:hypothetical protein
MTTEFNSGSPLAAEQPGSIGAAADIYRKLDRRPRRSAMKYAVPVITAAVILAGSAAAYMALTPGATPQSATPPAPQPTPAAAPQMPAQVAATPAPEVQTPVSHPLPPAAHRDQRRERVAAQTVRPRPHRAAQSAASSGEDANAYTPPAPVTSPPAAATAAPPAQAPAPATQSPPPAAPSSAAPAQPPS